MSVSVALTLDTTSVKSRLCNNVDILRHPLLEFKASLGSKRVLFSYFINTEPTELKLSQIASPGKSNAVNFFQKVSYIFSHGMQPSWIECCV